MRCCTYSDGVGKDDEREFPNRACSFGAYYSLEGLLVPIHGQCQRLRDLVRYHASAESSGITTILDSLRALILTLISFNGLGHLMKDDLSQSCIAIQAQSVWVDHLQHTTYGSMIPAIHQTSAYERSGTKQRATYVELSHEIERYGNSLVELD